MTNKQKGIVAMLISTFGFALMGLFIKLTGDIPVMQKVVFRTYIILITVYIMMCQSNVKISHIRHHKLLILRSILGTFGILLNYYAIDHLILSDSSILFRLSTFSLLLFSWFFLKEKMSKEQLISIIVAFIGVIFVVKPAFDIKIIPYLIAILGALFASAAYTVVRILGKKEQPLAVVFYFACFSSIVLTPFVIFTFQPMTLNQVIFATLAGLSASMGQVGVTYAYKYAPAKEVSIYNYFGVVFSAILSLFIFDAIPDIYSFIGYLIIFGSGYYMYRFNTKKVSI